MQFNVSKECVLEILREVIDPEVGENIVDLGLIYAVRVREHGLEIDLTMTSAACPMGDALLDDIHAALSAKLPANFDCQLNLVWEPTWSPDMISPEAKKRLGWGD